MQRAAAAAALPMQDNSAFVQEILPSRFRCDESKITIQRGEKWDQYAPFLCKSLGLTSDEHCDKVKVIGSNVSLTQQSIPFLLIDEDCVTHILLSYELNEEDSILIRFMRAKKFNNNSASASK